MSAEWKTGKNQSARGRKRARARSLIATVVFPCTWDVERSEPYGSDTLFGMADLLVHHLALVRHGEPVTAELDHAGRWHCQNANIRKLLNEFFGDDYRTRLLYNPYRLVAVALDAAWYLGGKADIHLTPRRRSEPGVVY